jgi:hypothetical protein
VARWLHGGWRGRTRSSPLALGGSCAGFRAGGGVRLPQEPGGDDGVMHP